MTPKVACRGLEGHFGVTGGHGEIRPVTRGGGGGCGYGGGGGGGGYGGGGGGGCGGGGGR